MSNKDISFSPEMGLEYAINLLRQVPLESVDLPEGMFSTCIIQKKSWIRSVAANPLADIESILSTIREVSHSDNA